MWTYFISEWIGLVRQCVDGYGQDRLGRDRYGKDQFTRVWSDVERCGVAG